MDLLQRGARRLTAFMAVTIALGLPVVLWSLTNAGGLPRGSELAFVVVLVVGVVLSEMLPIEMARKGREIDQITMSTTLALALTLVAPLAWVIVAQSVPLIIDDIRRAKHWSRPVFNVAQYSLAFAASKAVFVALAGPAAGRPLQPGELGAAFAAALTFFVVNQVLVGTAVALLTGTSLGAQLREDGVFQLATAGVLALLAPLVVVVAQFSLLLTPLLALPLLAVRSSARMAVRRQYDALHDALTGLPNRAFLRHALARRLGSTAQDAGSTAGTAVLLLDLDRFKEINDTLGHLAGDQLLVEVGARLAETTTSGPMAATGTELAISRLGGDEFAVMLGLDGPQDTWLPTIARTAQHLRAVLEETVVLADVRLSVQTSIGVAVSPWHGDTDDEILARADVALYQAKKDRDGWILYEPLQDTHSPERLALLSELRDGIEAGQLRVFYQPKCSAGSRRVHGVEALVRWQHPTRGLLDPDVFIPVAESTGIITQLTLAVLDISLRQGRRWLDEGRPLSIAVNLSARLLSDSLLFDKVQSALVAHAVPGELLTLEVTESTIMNDPPRATANLARLRALGVRLAIDDYGTGYSSLAYLRELDADELKIDRSFIRDLHTDASARSSHAGPSSQAVIVRSTIELGRSLGMSVVAEGVEDEGTWRALADLQCDLVQGYAMTRPLPVEEFDAWRRAWEATEPVDALVPARAVAAHRHLREGAVLATVPPAPWSPEATRTTDHLVVGHGAAAC